MSERLDSASHDGAALEPRGACAALVSAWLDATLPALAGDAAAVTELRAAVPTLIRALEARGERPAEEVARRWFWDHFPGSALARDKARWDASLASLADLVDRLKEEAP